MKDGLVKAVIGTGAAILTASAIGCATLGRKAPEGHIVGVKYKTMTQKQFPYITEKQVIGNKGYYFQKADSIDESLSMKIWREQDVSINLGVISKKVGLSSKMDYYPTKYIDEEEKGKEDIFVDGIELTTEGDYSIRAIIDSNKQLAKKMNIPNEYFGYKIITTEDGASFAIRTLTMPNGDKYFAPLVKEKKRRDKDWRKIPNFLDFYLIPFIDAEGNETKVLIDRKCGNITLYNKNDVYRPESLEHIKKRLRRNHKTIKNKPIKNLGREHKTIRD